ncbi:hypothetical protein NEIELOOT_01827 [Neisseria elongata subsp. glycolytica ATCC 29315]|uniref:Uncharacterized protein n=1 Tax=Neisseria elongata subsp. glycolytica ATCC 29315 TaxID=546263 RepID=D4DRY4_NEIEG|nr:hypothetical protein NEIELOOT_01827 [Neisseria elongata subsp. glycolytica ATCC 29315]
MAIYYNKINQLEECRLFYLSTVCLFFIRKTTGVIIICPV